MLFPPLPWSPTTKKGMPQEIEERFHGKPFYTFINVPPVFMFKVRGGRWGAGRLALLAAWSVCVRPTAHAEAPNRCLPVPCRCLPPGENIQPRAPVHHL